MQLLECIVKKPGLIEKKILKFDERTTVVYGKNDSGKTLIAKAIIETLLGEFSGTILLDKKIWEDFYFEISFINSLNRYRFIRNGEEFSVCHKDMNKDEDSEEKEVLRRLPGNDALAGGNGLFVDLYNKTNDRETIRLFNKIDIAAFANISYLPNPFEISKNGKINYDAIQKIILNDNSNFYALYENLSDNFLNAERTGSNTLLSEIVKTENELNDIKARLDISSLNVSKFERIKKEKVRLENELKDFNAELSKLRDLKSKLLLIQNNLKKLEEINQAIAEKNNEKKTEQRKKDSIMAMEEEIRQQYPQFYNFEESNIKNLKTIQETYREVRDVYEDVGNFHLEMAEKKNRYKNKILFINVVSIIIMAIFFGINYLFPVPVFTEYKIRITIGLLSLSIGCSALFFLFGLVNSRTGELRRKMEKKYGVERKLEGILKKNNIILNEYKLEAIYEYLVKYFEEYGEYSIKQSELLKMKDSLLENRSGNSIEDELEKLKIRVSLIRKEIDNDSRLLDDLNGIDLNVKSVARSINEKNRMIIDIKDKIKYTKNIISQIDKDSGKNYQSDETEFLLSEKNDIYDRLNKLNSYKSSLEFILGIIKEAIVIREEKQFSELLMNTAAVFHFLTDNQYKETIKDDTVKQIIRGEMDGDGLNMPVIHLILLSLKLAITDFLEDFEINLPLIIDEPFQNMDVHRISRLREIVEDKSGKRQIVIFTHNNMFKDWGSYVEL